MYADVDLDLPVLIFPLIEELDYLLLLLVLLSLLGILLSLINDFSTASDVYDGIIVDMLFKLGMPVTYIIFYNWLNVEVPWNNGLPINILYEGT